MNINKYLENLDFVKLMDVIDELEQKPTTYSQTYINKMLDKDDYWEGYKKGRMISENKDPLIINLDLRNILNKKDVSKYYKKGVINGISYKKSKENEKNLDEEDD